MNHGQAKATAFRELAKKLYLEGAHDADVAVATGHGLQSCRQVRYSLSIKYQSPKSANAEAMRVRARLMYADGATDDEVSREIKRSVSFCIKIRRAAGMCSSIAGSRPREQRWPLILGELLRGARNVAIATKLGVSRQRVDQVALLASAAGVVFPKCAAIDKEEEARAALLAEKRIEA